MTRALTLLLTVLSVLTGLAGCATRAPGGGSPAAGSPAAGSPAAGSPAAGGTSAPAREPAASVAGVTPSASATAFVMPAGGPNPAAAIPNPGTGTGDPLLVRALLPQVSSGRAAAFLLPPAVVALPDRDPGSLFIGLRQYASPVVGPQACDGWTAGLSAVVVSDFNRPGVELGVTEQSVPAQAGLPMFSEAVITGPNRRSPDTVTAIGAAPAPTRAVGGCVPLHCPEYGL